MIDNQLLIKKRRFEGVCFRVKKVARKMTNNWLIIKASTNTKQKTTNLLHMGNKEIIDVIHTSSKCNI